MKTTTPDLATAAFFRGIYSDLARKLGVTRQAVRRVALGNSRSKRIETALRREIRRRSEQVRRYAA